MSTAWSRRGVSSSLLLGLFATGWSAIVSIACVRWYVGLLGIESFGLIGFFATLQAAIAIFELGLGATINREMARSAALDNLDYARRLLRSLEAVYWGFAVVIALAICLAAPLIADHWLGASKLDHGEICQSLRLMGLVAALRWPVGLYQGSLVGLGRAQVSYRISATMTTIANGGAVLLLSYFFRSLSAYFIWQAMSAVIYVAWCRRSAWLELGKDTPAMFDAALLKKVLAQSIAMSGVAISGLILTQLDKLVVSSATALADFGRYSLATVLASGLSVILIPAFNIIYPRLSALVAAGDRSERDAFYRLGTRLFLSFLFPIALSGIVYSYDLLALWTGNDNLAAASATIASLLLVGSTLNGVMLFPYALQLAEGRTKLPFVINCTLIAVMVPFAILLVRLCGALGGALAWSILNAIYFLVGVTITHIYILPGLQKQWLLRDVAPALAISLVAVVSGYCFLGVLGPAPIARLGVATMVSIGATMVLLHTYRDVRALLHSLSAAASGRLRG